ncbi:hypothetical protein FJTKL_15200 [Diaporthe vaccinii]|uniref:Uncharacterized protein n=1 Tax=Diaporthe vaccinii TaxID=105482 RepID=A0ABR4E5P1_9PEZI
MQMPPSSLLITKLPRDLPRKVPKRIKLPLEADLALPYHLLVITPDPLPFLLLPAPRDPTTTKPKRLGGRVVDPQAPRDVQQPLPPGPGFDAELVPRPPEQVLEVCRRGLVAPDLLGRVHGIEGHGGEGPRRGGLDVGIVNIRQDDELVVPLERAQRLDRVREGGPAARPPCHRVQVPLGERALRQPGVRRELLERRGEVQVVLERGLLVLELVGELVEAQEGLLRVLCVGVVGGQFADDGLEGLDQAGLPFYQCAIAVEA